MTERAARRALAVVAAAGLAVAAYLTVTHAAGAAPVCSTSRGCEVVANSPYSSIAGIPVAAVGIAGYLVLLSCAAARGDFARFAGLAAALIGVAFSGYLTYLELFVIDAVCQWCIASAVLMAAALAASICRLRAAWADPAAG